MINDNPDEWDVVRKLGYRAWFDDKTPNDNPYPEDVDANSLYAAWNCGWVEADNDSYRTYDYL